MKFFQFSVVIVIVWVQRSYCSVSSLEPIDPKVRSMENITFTCTTTVPGDVSIIKWLFKSSGGSGETELSDGGKYHIDDETSTEEGYSYLTVTNLELDDSGEYRCRITGVATFSSQLTVYDVPTASMVMDPSNPNIELGINITFNCTSNYEAQIEFTKNGESLEGLERVDIESSVMTIVDSQLTDSGSYECVVNITDHIGLTERTEVARDIITVTTPVHVNMTTHLRLEEGETARFSCNATSYPFPSIVWYDGNQQLANETIGDKLFVSETEDQQRSTLVSVLNIRRVTYEAHHGTQFYCNASNNGTSDSDHGLLEIKDPWIALWPCLGVLIEISILLPLIFAAEKYLSCCKSKAP